MCTYPNNLQASRVYYYLNDDRPHHVTYSVAMKMKIGVSACLIGRACNFNGTDLLSEFVRRLPELAPVEYIAFCPEDLIFGTPRPNLRIVGGDGYDVLDGKAKVLNENNTDVTDQQLAGAVKFLDVLKSSGACHAILMDGSPSCGSNILLKEEGWPRGGFKIGVGVACALLRRNKINVFSSFDETSLSEFLSSMFPGTSIENARLDLRDVPMFKILFE